MKKMALGLILACLVGCAGVQSDDPTAINDALVGFTVNSQAEHWPEALKFVTADEAEEITDENGLMKEEYRVAASRLRISALKRMPWKVDAKGRLIGIKEVLDDFNKKYIVSEDEKKVGSNLEQMRQERIKRTLERGQRIMAGEEEQANQEPEVEVITNKLTEDEKRNMAARANSAHQKKSKRQQPIRPKNPRELLTLPTIPICPKANSPRSLNRKIRISKKTVTMDRTKAVLLPTSKVEFDSQIAIFGKS